MSKRFNVLAACWLQAALVAVTCMPGLCNQHLTSFDLVWETVHNRHFDTGFNGVDWQAMRDRYRPRIILSEGADDFSHITNQMLHELRLSHLLVASEEMLKIYMPTLFAEGTVGVDIRWVRHQAVVLRVKAGSTGEAAGLKPGYVISAIDGRRIHDIVASMVPMPPYNSRNYRGGTSNYIAGHLDGPPDTAVTVAFLDETGNQRKTKMKRRPRGAGQVISDAMPPVFIEFSSRRLDNDVGYIRFNHFAPPVDKAFVEALAKLKDTRGLIFDVRSNPGGYFRVMDTIVAALISREIQLYKFRFRNNTVRKTLQPSKQPYLKPVVVLIDETSTSCSEQFAACLKGIGRATIVGGHSPGYLLGAQWLRLPNGLSFMYTVLQPIPYGGQVVENKGVRPDIPSAIDRESLLRGRDPQLEAAIAHILNADSQP